MKGSPMSEALAMELIEHNNTGSVVKKRRNSRGSGDELPISLVAIYLRIFQMTQDGHFFS